MEQKFAERKEEAEKTLSEIESELATQKAELQAEKDKFQEELRVSPNNKAIHNWLVDLCKRNHQQYIIIHNK